MTKTKDKLPQTLDGVRDWLVDSLDTLPLASRSSELVPGEGEIDSKLLFIGEAPGFYEVKQGRPFVGRSGKFLRQCLEEVGLKADQFYITNIVKARPPDNRDPTPGEITAYKPFLDREIELIDPDLIVTLGRFSMAKFLPDVKISQVHGRLHRVRFKEVKRYVLPFYHPAAGLRSGQVKESFIKDCQKLPKILTWLADQATVSSLARTVERELF